jgi:hypothetical protein
VPGFSDVLETEQCFFSGISVFSQIWLQTIYELQNFNHPSIFFGCKMKAKYRNLAIYYYYFPSLLVIENCQNHFILFF